MHVVFVEPAFPANQRRFVHALAEVGARVSAIGEAPASALPESIARCLSDYVQVPSVVHDPSMVDAVRTLQSRGWVDRLEATVEAHIMAAARTREATSIPGTSVRTAWLCRDKPSMKAALREAGVPCAQSDAVDSPEAVRAFVERVGYPIILKPRDGAGSANTERVSSDAELEAAIPRQGLDRGLSVAVEEYIEGHEGFFDAMCIDGNVALEFISHYFPGVLEAMRTRWISPQIITTNRLDTEGYDEVKRLGRRVIEVLGIGTSPVHMEWFFGPKGLKFSEIGCRPPGVGVWDLYSAANEFDLYREWAHAIVHGSIDRWPSRTYAGGMIALRPDRDGTIVGLEGLDAMQSAFGQHIVDVHVPPPGTPTQPVEAGYMANAWVRMRHPDYDTLHEMMNRVGEGVQLRAR